MTVIKLPEDDGQAGVLLAWAEENCVESIVVLRELLQGLGDRPELSEADVKKAMGRVRETLKIVFDERERLHELRKRKRGIVNDFAIDFDAARDEIGQRLDRLRAAGSSEGVPG